MKCVYGYVYKIVNIKTGRFYIGATLCPEERLSGHITSLSKGKHFCKLMQKDFEEFGKQSFSMEIIEKVDANKLSESENYWISKYFDNMVRCYNIRNKAATNSRWQFIFNEDGKLV